MIARKKHLIWGAFSICALLVIGAMLWLSHGTLEAERQRARAEAERRAAEARADLEERTRLALWRIDAAGAAIMLRQNRLVSQADPHRSEAAPEVQLCFHVQRSQPFRYPALNPSDNPDDPATRARIRQFRELLSNHPLPGGEWQFLNTAAREGESNWQAVREETTEKNRDLDEKTQLPDQAPQKSPTPSKQSKAYQLQSNVNERAQRAKAIGRAIDNDPAASYAGADPLAGQRQLKPSAPASETTQERADNARAVADAAPSDTPPTAVADPSPLRAVWIGDELFLLRQITPPNTSTPNQLQGVWLDWKILAQQLLAEIPDLLPNATLQPAKDESAIDDPLTLVSFPLRLVRHEATLPVATIPAPTHWIPAPLWIAWSAIIVALLASMILIRGVMRLSERRASFVSAVTHELRTPLTTFRLYADLLSQKNVVPEKRQHYLSSLSRESDRLTHLVENVLAFSRIENGRAHRKTTDTTLGDMIESMRERLEARLAAANLSLKVVDSDPPAATTPIQIDLDHVEHILFNLIDNAAKYAIPSGPAEVEIKFSRTPQFAEIRICDHGPGIPDPEKSRIFKAFHKSAHEAAETQPGVGLGLALSRRLAESLGGSLTCLDAPSGACFLLRLPR